MSMTGTSSVYSVACAFFFHMHDGVSMTVEADVIRWLMNVHCNSNPFAMQFSVQLMCFTDGK